MNPNKCAFGVSAGEFLGFLVHEGGIEVGKKSIKCHTRFPEGNQMHLICVPGSSSTHMIDEMSVIS
jgi:hypothetical protein